MFRLLRPEGTQTAKAAEVFPHHFFRCGFQPFREIGVYILDNSEWIEPPEALAHVFYDEVKFALPAIKLRFPFGRRLACEFHAFLLRKSAIALPASSEQKPLAKS